MNPPPSPSEILKAVRGIGMDIFWNCPIPQTKCGLPDYQITMPNGLHLFATISQVATLIINDKKATKILKF